MLRPLTSTRPGSVTARCHRCSCCCCHSKTHYPTRRQAAPKKPIPVRGLCQNCKLDIRNESWQCHREAEGKSKWSLHGFYSHCFIAQTIRENIILDIFMKQQSLTGANCVGLWDWEGSVNLQILPASSVLMTSIIVEMWYLDTNPQLLLPVIFPERSLCLWGHCVIPTFPSLFSDAFVKIFEIPQE